MSTQPEYFLDTAFAIALASKSDAFRQDALELAGRLNKLGRDWSPRGRCSFGDR